MELEELSELIAGANAYHTSDGVPRLDYPDILKTTKDRLAPFWENQPGSSYRFTTDEWDIFELLNPKIADIFNDQIRKDELRTHQVPPHGVARYLIATPAESSDMLMALGLPPVSRALLIVLILTDNDEYVPLYATYRGKPLDERAKQISRELIQKIAADFTLDTAPPARPAPSLPISVKQKIETAKSREMSPDERRAMVKELLALDPIQLSEAITRVLPFTARGPAMWITQGSEDAIRLAQAHAKAMRSLPAIYMNADLREAPWKTGWMRPRPYEPRFQHGYSWEHSPIYV